MRRTAAWCIGIALVAGVFFFYDPVVAGFPSCPFYAITGFYCPGCGSQRALHAIVHGNIGQAMQFNPLIGLALLYFLCEAILALGRRKGQNWKLLSHRARVPLVILVIVLLFWVTRNIPVQPFTWLAP